MYFINRILLICSVILYSFAVTANEKIAYLNKKYSESIFVSAKNHIMIDSLKDAVLQFISKDFISKTIKISHGQSYLLKDIYKSFKVESRKDDYDFVEVRLKGKKADFDSLNKSLASLR